MYVCICTSIRVCNMYMYIVQVYVYGMCMCTRVMCRQVSTYACMLLSIHVCMHACMYVGTYVCVNVSRHIMYVYAQKFICVQMSTLVSCMSDCTIQAA